MLSNVIIMLSQCYHYEIIMLSHCYFVCYVCFVIGYYTIITTLLHLFQGDGNIVIKGDSSMRLFNHTEITHPNFDPAQFLNLARNDSVQSVEIQPVSDLPYFMFIPPELLKVRIYYILINEILRNIDASFYTFSL